MRQQGAILPSTSCLLHFAKREAITYPYFSLLFLSSSSSSSSSAAAGPDVELTGKVEVAAAVKKEAIVGRKGINSEHDLWYIIIIIIHRLSRRLCGKSSYLVQGNLTTIVAG